MKKIYLICTATIFLSALAEIKEKKTDRTFYNLQPFFTLGSRLSGWKSLLFSLEPRTGFRVTGGVTRSYKSEHMAEYFLFNHNRSLIVRGSALGNAQDVTTNVRADWLGLPNNFEGTLNLHPSYRSWGVMITGKQSLQDLCDCKFLKRSSLFIEIPIVQNETNLTFTQSNVSNTAANTNDVYDILTAFNNRDWKYQKISTVSLKKLALAEIRLGLSNTFLSSDRALVAMTSALSIPTTQKCDNKYMFEPQPGYNGHPGMISTVHMAFPLSGDDCNTHFSLFLDGEHIFVVRTKQYKTFDLLNNPWSRFLPMRLKDQVANTTIPGVNVLTREIRFSPYSQIDVIVGAKIASEYITCEVGFGAWAHYKGRIKFTDEWQEIYGIAGTTANTTASASTIRTQAVNDNTFIPIKEADLDIESALSPSQVLYKAHASLDIHNIGKNATIFATLGWQMQIPSNKTNGFKTWSLWITTGADF